MIITATGLLELVTIVLGTSIDFFTFVKPLIKHREHIDILYIREAVRTAYVLIFSYSAAGDFDKTCVQSCPTKVKCYQGLDNQY